MLYPSNLEEADPKSISSIPCPLGMWTSHRARATVS